MLRFSDPASFSSHPTEHELPTAPLKCISLGKLISNDRTDSAELFEACRDVGFFAIDLLDHADGLALVDGVDNLFMLADSFFALEIDQKRSYASPRERPLIGYKEIGVTKVDRKGTPDCVETFGISKDDLLDQSPSGTAMMEPEFVAKHRNDIQNFVKNCHRLVEIICLHLDRHLGLPEGTLASYQHLQARSGSQLRLTKTASPNGVPDAKSISSHTDIGCVTVLFNVLGGLQILPPNGNIDVDADWLYVRPRHGCAIINMGDAMVAWTNGILRSNIHRVTFPPGRQAGLTRYSIAYFSRPLLDVAMNPLEQSKMISEFAGNKPKDASSGMTAAEWDIYKSTAIYLDPSTLKSLGAGSGLQQVPELK